MSESEAVSFFELFKPDQNRYVQKDGHGNIRTIKSPLTTSLVEDFFMGKTSYLLSFFVRGNYRDYVGIDIDDHDTGGWINDMPTEKLQEKYKNILGAIGQEPSMVFRSPRGIHAFWLLTKNLPNKVIEATLKDRLGKDLEIEILPTSGHALMIPRPSDYLDVMLNPDPFPGYHRSVQYEPEAILGKGCLPSEIRVKHKSDRFSAKGETKVHQSLESIEKREARFLPLKNGKPNEVYKHLVGLYKAGGLSQEQAIERFNTLVKKSRPDYSGRLLDDIEARVESSYRNMENLMGTLQMESSAELYRRPGVQKIIEEILALEKINTPTRIQMKNTHEAFLLELFNWIRAYHKVQAADQNASYWNFMYPNSKHYYREGYFPLPYKLLRQWNVHYDRHLRLLKEHTILEESPYGYSTTQKRCKYYRINCDINPILIESKR